jgi:uncharacterized protein (DUF1697 family)
MSRYAAFLRGMNVGGHRIRNDELCAVLTGMGLEQVHTLQASGNVAFAAADQSLEQLTLRIEEHLERSLGYAVPTFLRTAEEIRAIAAMRPFAAKLVQASAGKLQVSILARGPTREERETVLALATAADLLAFGERELYWLPSGGLMESPLELKAIDRLLGPVTRRTKGTIERMAAKHFAG